MWRSWIIGPIGLLAIGIAGTLLFTSAKGQVLHPDPQSIPSTTQPHLSASWSEAADRTRSHIRASLAEQNLPGLSVAVGAGGAILWSEGFGWADLETRTPVTPDTRFRIGTASTVLTAAAAGRLLEQGRLTLDHEIQSYVPKYPKKQWPVTLRHLLANSAGLDTDSGEQDPLHRQRCAQPLEALPSFAQSALLFQPGTQRRSSSYGWILVSAAVEAAAKQPFLQYIGEQVFQPLKMTNTGAESATGENPEGIGEPGEDAPFMTLFRNLILQPLGIASPRVQRPEDPATVYTPGFRYSPAARHGLHVVPPRNLSCFAGAMAFYSTPSDLVRLGMATNGGALLQPAAGYDGEFMGRRVVSLRVLRDKGLVVAVTSNGSSVDTSALAAKVAETFARSIRP